MQTETDNAAVKIIVQGRLVVRLDGYTVAVGEQDVPVTLTEFLVLVEFVRQPYKVFSRQELVEAIRADRRVQAEQLMTRRAIDLHISRLRKKLSQAGCDCIKTMRFVGYRFVPCGAE